MLRRSEKKADGPLTVMGIDPSLTGMAICFALPGDVGTQFLSWRFSSKPRGRSIRARIDRYAELTDLVMQATDRHPPSLVVLEGYSFASQGSAHLDLAELGGFLRGDLCSLDADLLECSPMTLKKFATGKGKGNKIQMVAAITRRWDVGFATDDEYDAYALARIALCIAGIEPAENIAQKEAVETVLNGRTRKVKGAQRAGL